MGKSENDYYYYYYYYYYFETIAALGLKIDLNIQLTMLIILNEYQRSRPFY